MLKAYKIKRKRTELFLFLIRPAKTEIMPATEQKAFNKHKVLRHNKINEIVESMYC